MINEFEFTNIPCVFSRKLRLYDIPKIIQSNDLFNIQGPYKKYIYGKKSIIYLPLNYCIANIVVYGNAQTKLFLYANGEKYLLEIGNPVNNITKFRLFENAPFFTSPQKAILVIEAAKPIYVCFDSYKNIKWLFERYKFVFCANNMYFSINDFSINVITKKEYNSSYVYQYKPVHKNIYYYAFQDDNKTIKATYTMKNVATVLPRISQINIMKLVIYNYMSEELIGRSIICIKNNQLPNIKKHIREKLIKYSNKQLPRYLENVFLIETYFIGMVLQIAK